uniref:Uncharacterized protein n=1 Tax=Pararge aegeria TaxID=116150 RepID=S4PXN4_9NEOP
MHSNRELEKFTSNYYYPYNIIFRHYFILHILFGYYFDTCTNAQRVGKTVAYDKMLSFPRGESLSSAHAWFSLGFVLQQNKCHCIVKD